MEKGVIIAVHYPGYSILAANPQESGLGDNRRAAPEEESDDDDDDDLDDYSPITPELLERPASTFAKVRIIETKIVGFSGPPACGSLFISALA